MLFRIDMERFLTHAIDHFTMDELTHFHYAILGHIKNGARRENVVKINSFFPSFDIQKIFIEHNDKSLLRKMYFEELDKYKGDFYLSFINPFLQNVNTMIICYEKDNVYVDVFLEYMKEKYSIESINLNELFIKGRIGPIYIDKDEIHGKAVKIRRAAARDAYKSLESTRDGKLSLLNKMTHRMKIKKLKELGIHVTKSDKDDIDKLLMDSWVEDH